MHRVLHLFLYASLFFYSLRADAQTGCTDPQALNYNILASTNDGSCAYAITNYAPVLKATLPDDLQEISGLTFAGARWWGHNDSGNAAEFYRILPETGGAPQKIKLKNADNQDWEDITTDNTALYVGDFGNNYNDRQDLGLYRVPLGAIGTDNTETVNDDEWTFLPFVYTDQTDFSTQPEDSTEYDCEAMIFLNGAPHLFTKNRKLGTTTHYVVNTATGQAQPLETFDTQGLITGASLSPDGKLVVLLGYTLSGVPKIFCWLLWDWHDGLVFNGNKRRLELGNVFAVGQAEAIGFNTNRSGYIANEKVAVNGITITVQHTYAFDFAPWVPESVATGEPQGRAPSLFPNPFTQTVQLPATVPGLLRVYNSIGRIVLETSSGASTLDASTWPAGWYVFIWNQAGRIMTARGLKNN